MVGVVGEWLDMMPSTVTLTTAGSLSAYGVPSYGGTARSVRARITDTDEQTNDVQGNEVVAHTIVWLASTGTVSPTDKLTLPDGRTPPILRVERQSDETGWHHLKVYLGA